MADGGGAAATAAAVIADTAAFIAENAFQLVIAGILLDTGRDIVEKAEEEFEFATDRLVEINECREQMACAIHEHNLSVTLPFQRQAMQTALSLSVPSSNYGGLCAFYHNLAMRSLSGGNAASRSYLNLFCVRPSPLRREIDYFAGISAVDASYARAKNQERREELLREIKVDAVLSAHRGTFSSPLPSFGLLESASNLYSYIQANAAGALGGGVAALTYGATTLTDTFSSGDS